MSSNHPPRWLREEVGEAELHETRLEGVPEIPRQRRSLGDKEGETTARVGSRPEGGDRPPAGGPTLTAHSNAPRSVLRPPASPTRVSPGPQQVDAPQRGPSGAEPGA